MTTLAPTPAAPCDPSFRHERDTARLAAIARADTIDGGAHALVLARRLDGMGSSINAVGIVADVYSASTSRHHPVHDAWACPECGSVHLGYEPALRCCEPEEDF